MIKKRNRNGSTSTTKNPGNKVGKGTVQMGPSGSSMGIMGKRVSLSSMVSKQPQHSNSNGMNGLVSGGGGSGCGNVNDINGNMQQSAASILSTSAPTTVTRYTNIPSTTNNSFQSVAAISSSSPSSSSKRQRRSSSDEQQQQMLNVPQLQLRQLGVLEYSG